MWTRTQNPGVEAYEWKRRPRVSWFTWGGQLKKFLGNADLRNADAGYKKGLKSIKIFRLEKTKAKIDKGKSFFIKSDDGKK